MWRRALLIGVGAALFMALFCAALSVTGHLGRATLIEIDAVGTQFRFPGSGGTRMDELEVLLDVRDATLFQGPAPVGHESIQWWLSMTWPGATHVMLCEHSASPVYEMTVWRVELLVDFDAVPNARALLLGVSESGGPVHGTVVMMVGPSYGSETSRWGPTGIFHRIAHRTHWRHRAEWSDPDPEAGSRRCGNWYGIGTTLDSKRVRPLLEQVAGIVEGLGVERVRTISEFVEGMATPAARTWCISVRYRGQETPLLLHANAEGAVVDLTLSTTSLELSHEVQMIVNE